MLVMEPDGWEYLARGKGLVPNPPSDADELASLEKTAGAWNASLAFLCPCFVYASIMNHFHPDERRLGSRPVAAGCLYFALSPLGPLTQWMCVFPLNLFIRKDLNQLLSKSDSRQDQEEKFKTFVVSWCCAPCSLAEVNREMKALRPGGAPSAPAFGVPPRQQRFGACRNDYCRA